VAATATVEEEIQHLIADANYHIHKNWAKPGSRRYTATRSCTPTRSSSRGASTGANDEDRLLWNSTNGNPWGMAVVHVLANGEEPSPAMLASSKAMLDWLTSRDDIPARQDHVFGHGECGEIYGGGPSFGNNSNCPGLMLDFTRNYRKGAPMPDPQPNKRYFPETGQEIHDAFKVQWETLEKIQNATGTSNVAMDLVGYPITPELREVLGDGNEYTVQYFQRARFEWHPERNPGMVMLGLVGAELQACRQDADHDCACEEPKA
jgi:hypothetical protein